MFMMLSLIDKDKKDGRNRQKDMSVCMLGGVWHKDAATHAVLYKIYRIVSFGHQPFTIDTLHWRQL